MNTIADSQDQDRRDREGDARRDAAKDERATKAALDLLIQRQDDPKTRLPKKTMRQYLDLFGGPDHIAMDEYTRQHCLDTPMDEAWFCTATDRPGDSAGRLFVICGGYCIMGFKQDKRYRGCLYLVFDDQDGSTWDAKRHAGMQTGSRPSPQLRLVQSI